MKDSKWEQRIKTALEHAAPDKLDSILSSCDNQKGAVIEMKEKKKRKWNVTAFAAVAAVLLICVGGYSQFYKGEVKADSVIMLDVNPSLSLYVSEKEKVLSAEALNEDAEEILGTMDLAGTSLEVAVNAIIGSMLQKGYLGDMQNSILVSVENSNASRGKELQQKVASLISASVGTDSMDAAVLSQTVSADDEVLAELSQTYGISLGKAALIQELRAQDATLDLAVLSKMTINEIALLASSKHVTGETIAQTGTASDKAYIGREAALAAACAHAGIKVADAVAVEIEFDSKKGTIVYEVEFRTDNAEYDYAVNAATGEILGYEKESKQAVIPDNGGQSGSQTGGNQTSGSQTGGSQTSGSQAGGNQTSGSQAKKIGEAAAKSAALTHAGCKESDTSYINAYVEYDDGREEHYEVEFVVGNTEYDYEIDLYTGKVLSHSKETHTAGGGADNDRWDDDWDDDKDDKQDDYDDDWDDDKDDKPATKPAANTTSYIGETAALSTALTHAGVSEASLQEKKVELDEDDGVMVYEIEFKSGQTEYEYEIRATDGTILYYDKEIDD